MICENCKNKIEKDAITCPHCGYKTQEEVKVNNVVVEQPVVNQVIAEEHKAKETKKEKNIILIVTSVIFFALAITTVVLAYFMPNKEFDEEIEVPIPSVKPSEQVTTKTIEYNGFNVAYLSNYEASLEDNLLIIENDELYYQVTIHPNITEDQYEQSKNSIKKILVDGAYIIDSEETSIRSGIEFQLYKLSNIVDNEKETYEYYLALENDNLYEILVYEIKESSYSEISNQLRTIVKQTKRIN